MKAQRVVTATDHDGSPDDYIVLDFDHRHRRRMSMTSESGRKFLLDLACTVALQDGHRLVLEDGSKIAVRAKPERVADILADDSRQLARFAWHLGNRHLPTQILEDRLRILEDHVIVSMLRGLGATVELVEAPFQPEGGAYGHSHEH